MNIHKVFWYIPSSIYLKKASTSTAMATWMYICSCVILFGSDFRCRDGNLCWLGLLALLPLSHVDRNFSHTFPMLTPWANSFVSAKLPRFFPRQATTTDQSGKAEEAKTKFAKCCLQCIRQHHGCSCAVKFSIPFSAKNNISPGLFNSELGHSPFKKLSNLS